ncbi:MAG TPA: hemolysin family protein [Candidatus Sulfotelmatobacter sp.]|jgi:CBS domain containing-hemolysin-like protein
MNWGVVVALLPLLALLALASYVDRVYQEIGKFLSRDFQDNVDVFEQRVEPRLRVSRARASLSMSVLKQFTTATIALLVGFAIFSDLQWNSYEIAQGAVSLIVIVIICNQFLPYVFFSRTNGSWLIRWTWLLNLLIYLVLPVTIVLGFLQSVVSLTRENTREEPESAAEAVDALIEAGQEEGIIQEGDRDLIQSVVEFSGKTARDAMKPRPDMFAVPVLTTVERFIQLLGQKHYSRVPVYQDSIHNIKGIVHVQDVLQVPDSEASTRTLDSLMRRDVYFVPESKLGSDLLREMQKSNIRMAIVVDEYGGVAGLVTIEDLVEEIVGEIRDEHEKPDIVKETPESYIVPGRMDVDRLAELFGTKPEGKESATIAGLVSELAGHIPQKGETVDEDGLRFEVLESTDRKVERVRVSLTQPRQLKLI